MWGKDRRRKRKFKGEIESLSARRRRKTFFFLGRECLLWKNLTLLSAKPQTESSFSSFLRGKFKSTLPTHTQSSPFFPFLTDCNLTHLLLQLQEGKGEEETTHDFAYQPSVILFHLEIIWEMYFATTTDKIP